jgi:ubiquinone/menaquinone biosynthesis C-methylase UbiE
MPSTVSSRPIFSRMLARAAVLEERRGGADHRRRLLAGLRGRVIELGAGSGVSFAYYPATVTELIAVEPEAHLRALAQEAAHEAPIAVRVVDGMADRLPADDAAMDAGVVTAVLCSVPDPGAALAELLRVIRPGGELRFFEHVAARSPRLARFQRALDATLWPRLMGDCHTHRDTEAAIRAAGFQIEERERFSFRAHVIAAPVAPRILGRARRPA